MFRGDYAIGGNLEALVFVFMKVFIVRHSHAGLPPQVVLLHWVVCLWCTPVCVQAQPPQPPPAPKAPQPPVSTSASPSAAAKDSAESEAGQSASGKFDSKAKTKGKGKKGKGKKPFDTDLELDADQEAKTISPKKGKNSTPIWELVAKAEVSEPEFLKFSMAPFDTIWLHIKHVQ